MNRFKIACVFGTRPEVIKMAPVIRALQSRPELFDVNVICTGQHRELLTPLIEWFGLKIDFNMDVMTPNQGLNELFGRMMIEFGKLFQPHRFDCIIGQGDTTTVLTSAIASFHSRIPFAHVEAGLRTYDRYSPFPEEMNRVMVGRLATIHFAPTENAVNNLLNEGVAPETISMVGNTVIDALHFTVDKLNSDVSSSSGTPRKKSVLVTVHRRENFGQPLIRICKAIRQIATDFDIRIIFAVHPNPSVSQVVNEALSDVVNVELVAPLPYQKLVEHLQACHFVLTDSGGLQEEAPALNKPVIVLRDDTERPELVECGGSMLAGSDEALIYKQAKQLLTDAEAYSKMVVGYSPYGDGKSSQRLVEHLYTMLKKDH